MAKGELVDPECGEKTNRMQTTRHQGSESSQEQGERSGRQRSAVALIICAALLAVGLLSSPQSFHGFSGIAPHFNSLEVKATSVGISANNGERGTTLSPLDEVRMREEQQSESHVTAIDEALKRHDLAIHASVNIRLASRRMPETERKQLALRGEQLNGDFHDHPWDLFNPEGMPLPGGQMESAAAMVAQAGEPQQAVQPGPESSDAKRLQADAIMAGGGTLDPRAMLDLSESLKDHEKMRGRQEESQQQQASAQMSSSSPDVLQSAPAAQMAKINQGAQGFVTGDHLKVSAEEYHRRMRYYMPSSDGRLISPFDWFQAAGQPPLHKEATKA